MKQGMPTGCVQETVINVITLQATFQKLRSVQHDSERIVLMLTGCLNVGAAARSDAYSPAQEL